MAVNGKGFSPFDIRGIYPEDVNEELAYLVGRAAPSLFAMKKIVVGRDVRLSSPSLEAALVRGLTESGCDVLLLGECGTEMMYFAVMHLKLDGGIMVTASHNPKEYNGLKFVKKEARPISEKNGLRELREDILAGNFPKSDGSGKTEHLDIMDAYIDHLLSYIDVNAIRPYRILANVGNGAAGRTVAEIAKRLPCEIIPLYPEPDGNFPHGVPNPLRKENRAATLRAVIDTKADIGVAWDGDFDRCFLVDEKGGFIEGYFMVGFLAESFLKKEKGGTVIYDPRLVWNTIEIAEKLGGHAVICRSGHAFIKDKMREMDAVYGGELSSHHYFRNFSYCDSGMIPWLLILELMSKSGKPLSALMQDRQERYPVSGEISRKVKDPMAVFARVEEKYGQGGKVTYIDGLSVEFEKWRFNLRMSSTEPEIRLNVESRGDRVLMEEKTKELLTLIY